MTNQAPPTIDPTAAQRWHNHPASESPWLHEEVARRMEERLDWIKLQPQSWTHWEPLRGGMQAHALLTRRYPAAGCTVVESNDLRLRQVAAAMAKPWWKPARWTAPATRFEYPLDGAANMLWANMSLHMAADPQSLMARWHRALAVDGFLMFSCFGPDTLLELRAIYQASNWPMPAHDFTDMHDWGDMLAEAGFAEPVMDMERITLTFESPERLLQELRGMGRNLHPDRFTGLRGRQWYRQLQQAVKAQPLQITFEIIYGHAFKPKPRLDMKAETTLTLAQMREALGQSKK